MTILPTLTVETLLALIAASMTHAGLAALLDICFAPGNIFQAYLPWLAKQLGVTLPNEEALKNSQVAYADALHTAAQEQTFWYKPLGGCVYCMSVWLAVPHSILWLCALPELGLLFIPALSFAATYQLKRLY